MKFLPAFQLTIYISIISAILSADIFAREALDCGALKNAYGPFDYTNPVHVKEKLPIVEIAHFTPEVSALMRGNRGELPMDIDYTLRAFPNHHRALYSMATYQLRKKRPIYAEYYSMDCYFKRAIEFRPNDGKVRLVYGIYFHKSSKLDLALEQYLKALLRLPDDPELHYNMALLYLDMKDKDKAIEHANIAYRYNYPLTGLRKKLGINE